MNSNDGLPNGTDGEPSPRQMQTRAMSSFVAVVREPGRYLSNDSESDKSESVRISPLTDLPLPSVAKTAMSELDEVFSRARTTQVQWERLPISSRAKLLRTFESLMWKYQEQILDVIQWETGKPRKHAFEEILDVSQNIGFVTGKGPSILRDRATSGAVPILSRATVSHHPIGVIGVIAPWNYPFTLAISDACAALLAGNSVVLKPASQTPLCAIMVYSLLQRAGLAPGVFQLVLGPGKTAGESVARQADYVMFTGSTKVGSHIAELCGSRLIGFSGELGGKNPSVVFSDADLKKWAETAKRECFSNSGQLCVSIERIFIHESVWDRALSLLIEAVATLRPGRNFQWTTDFGPLVDSAQFDRVNKQIDDAISKGATVLTGGRPLPELGPTGYCPTLLTNVTEEMQLYSEETFGPIVALYPWSNQHQMVNKVNNSAYGLNGSVWSSDRSNAIRVAGRLQVGSVSINEGYGATWGSVTAPIGGFKSSGVGRRHGPEGLLKYTETQTVTTGPKSLDPWLGMSARTWAETEGALVRGRNLLWRLTSRA